MSNRPSPVVLCILDGWGEGVQGEHNAIACAATPNIDHIREHYPWSMLETSGLAVGLPKGQMGNSEVGHMNIGSGRIVMQNLPRIDAAISDGSIATNANLQKFVESLKDSSGVCHILGLLSPGGVHSHQNHIFRLAKILAGQGIEVALHLFTDGRDVPPQSAIEYLEELDAQLGSYDNVNVVTIGGRYYAMDRDNRWDRVEKSYNAIVGAEGGNYPTAKDAVEAAYADGKSDEFIIPSVIGGYAGMRDGDGLMIANFRSDRVREIASSLVVDNFTEFARKRQVNFVAKVGMVEYSSALNPYLPAMFTAQKLEKILGEVVEQQGFKQLRIAETEKYAHVTFFFNGGREQEFAGEERILIPSPKVATYDLKPEMSAREVTSDLVKAVESEKFDLIVVNYANTDMVGHTGVNEAALRAVEVIDECVGQLSDSVQQKDGVLIITADHGNAEEMVDVDTGQPNTSHTTNAVPFYLVSKKLAKASLNNGRLCDIAPTILDIMQIQQPSEMLGESLLKC